MKVANVRKVNDRVADHVGLRQLMSFIYRGLVMPIGEHAVRFTNCSELQDSVSYVQKYSKRNGIDYSEDEALISLMIQDIASGELDIYDMPPLPPVVLHQIVKESRVFHRGEFDDNPYLKNIHFDDAKCGNFRLTHDIYAKYEPVLYDIPAIKYVPIPRIGVFDHRFKFPCLKENHEAWMSVTPNEIYTMQKPIEEAAGNVLTLGLGIGYYAYMVSQKPDVSHVTIIEKEPAVIKLFETVILPQFEHKEKITVIQADAMEYMEALEDGQFDYCFADIWIGCYDYIPYLTLKKICKKFESIKMSYWIEDSIVQCLTGYVFTIILQELYKSDNLDKPKPVPDNPKDAFIMQYLEDLLKDAEIKKADQLDYYLDYRNLLHLLD